MVVSFWRPGAIGVVFQEFVEHAGGFAALAAAQVDLGQQKLGMGEVRGIDLACALEVLFGEVHASQPEIGLAELRVCQGVVGAREHGPADCSRRLRRVCAW